MIRLTPMIQLTPMKPSGGLVALTLFWAAATGPVTSTRARAHPVLVSHLQADNELLRRPREHAETRDLWAESGLERAPGAKSCTAPCDDGDPCTIGDACTAAGCKGKPKVCSDGNACTDDSCVPGKGTCAHKPVPVATSCDALTNPCIGQRCDGKGQCVSKPIKARCDDNNPCTLDLCKGLAADRYDCVNTPQQEGKACADGDPCTEAETCQAGACVGQKDVCKPIYADDFPCGDMTWSLGGPDPSKPKAGLQWYIDSKSAWPAPHSGACMLYMLDGVGLSIDTKYPTQYVTYAYAYSPPVKIPSHGEAVLRFWAMTGFSRMTCEVHIDAGYPSGSSMFIEGLAPTVYWARETISLKQWAGSTLRIGFSCDGSDVLPSYGQGLFIDDLRVSWRP